MKYSPPSLLLAGLLAYTLPAFPEPTTAPTIEQLWQIIQAQQLLGGFYDGLVIAAAFSGLKLPGQRLLIDPS